MSTGSIAEMILDARNAGGSAGVDAVDERFVKNYPPERADTILRATIVARRAGEMRNDISLAKHHHRISGAAHAGNGRIDFPIARAVVNPVLKAWDATKPQVSPNCAAAAPARIAPAS
jgi:hypothetical protein